MTVRETVALQNPQALFYDQRYDAALLRMTLGFGTKSLAALGYSTFRCWLPPAARRRRA